jgi:hypothetical protein
MTAHVLSSGNGAEAHRRRHERDRLGVDERGRRESGNSAVLFRWRPNLADESDNHLVELAVAGGATAIVTNNVRDLRSGELVFPDIGIMTPAEFLKTLKTLKTLRRRP